MEKETRNEMNLKYGKTVGIVSDTDGFDLYVIQHKQKSEPVADR